MVLYTPQTSLQTSWNTCTISSPCILHCPQVMKLFNFICHISLINLYLTPKYILDYCAFIFNEVQEQWQDNPFDTWKWLHYKKAPNFSYLSHSGSKTWRIWRHISFLLFASIAPYSDKAWKNQVYRFMNYKPHMVSQLPDREQWRKWRRE